MRMVRDTCTLPGIPSRLVAPPPLSGHGNLDPGPYWSVLAQVDPVAKDAKT